MMRSNSQDRNGFHFIFRRKSTRTSIAGRIVGALVAILAVCATTLPAVAATRSGQVVATIRVAFKVAPPSGSFVSCTLSLIGSDNLSPSDSKFVTVRVNGSNAVCRIRLYYKWTVQDTASKMAIAYSVSGPDQSSSGIYRTIRVPANGTRTNVSIDVTQ